MEHRYLPALALARRLRVEWAQERATVSQAVDELEAAVADSVLGDPRQVEAKLHALLTSLQGLTGRIQTWCGKSP